MIHPCVTRLISVWHDWFICLPWCIPTSNLTNPYVWHDSSIRWHDWFIRVSWIPALDALQDELYCLFCRALLQKRPIIWRSLLIVATPYHTWSLVWLLQNALIDVYSLWSLIHKCVINSSAGHTTRRGQTEVNILKSQPIYIHTRTHLYTHDDTYIYIHERPNKSK